MGVDAVDVRRPEQLDEIDALIIPGGESTTIGKLAEQYRIIPKLRERVAEGMPVWGTCAGAIFIAKDVPGHPHPLAGLMDMPAMLTICSSRLIASRGEFACTVVIDPS